MLPIKLLKNNIRIGFTCCLIDIVPGKAKSTYFLECIKFIKLDPTVEKVKIPEAKENIRVIQVYIGDQQTAAVVRGKISKKKLVEA